MNESRRKTILIVDDHVEILRTLVMNFKARGFDTLTATDARTASSLMAEANPDAVILDLGLPDMDGIDLINHVRPWTDIPILVLSGRTELEKKLGALRAGADDYISKPFSVDELIARVDAVLRRKPDSNVSKLYYLNLWKIDLSRHQISDMENEKPDLHLTKIEWRLLEYLLSKAGSLVSQKELLQAVWGKTYESETNYLRLFISQLRRKLEPNPQLPIYILTEPGIGYRLMAEVNPIAKTEDLDG
ncbi:MAG: response regulator transcription factor [Candidatus Nanopelagicaceae bacterium]|jgi:two-component system KDP operon response regulator KdpE